MKVRYAVLPYKDEGHDYNRNPVLQEEVSTVQCECGNSRLLVNWLEADYPLVGGFLKVTCPLCNHSEVLFANIA